MRSQVFRKIRRLSERPSAVRAFERFQSIMDPLMNRQSTHDRKGLSTPGEVAGIRFLLRMPPHMLLQRRSLREILLAKLTLERSMPRMTLKMPTNLLLTAEPPLPIPIAPVPETLVPRLAPAHMRRGEVRRQLVRRREH